MDVLLVTEGGEITDGDTYCRQQVDLVSDDQSTLEVGSLDVTEIYSPAR